MRLSTRLMLAMVALVLFTAAAVALLSYRNILAVVLPRSLDIMDTHTNLVAVALQRSVDGAHADVASFRSIIGLDEIMEATQGDTRQASGFTLAQLCERISRRLKAELEAKPSYLQFRIIGVADSGREIVRVERTEREGPVRIVPADDLQSKGDRPYFLKAITRRAGEIDVSAVELNQERGAIETPPVPTLRVATPVFARSGQLFGIITINVDLRPAFDELRASARPYTSVYVVDERGDYLVHPDRSLEFGFEFGRTARIQSDFPDLAGALKAGDMEPAIINGKGGSRFGVALASVALARGPRVTVIEAIPYDRILASTVAVRNSSIIAASGATIIAVFLAVIVARGLSRPLTQMAGAVQSFARGETATVPITASGEIGLLARAFEQMRTEVRAKTAELEYEIKERQRVFDTSLDLIFVTDRKGHLLRVNPASTAILGYEPHDMAGHSVANFIHPDDLESMRREMIGSRRGRSKRSFDCRYTHKDGQVVPMAWSGVWSEPEEKYYFFGRDMRERTKLEQQLRQAQKMDAIGQLTGGVAHDFNNILTVITSTIDILAESVADRPQAGAIVKLIDGAAERGTELTQRLLAFARRQPLQPRDTDINALIRETEKLLRPLLGAQIDIEVALGTDVWHAMIDRNQLSTALVNLTVNARDAMPDGGKLTIETENVMLDEAYAETQSEVRPGPYALIAVSDTGTGIPAKLVDKVFEPFFTTKGVGKGTGLGLSMVFGFVKQSGGHIKIYSEVGHGTTVKLYLPRASGADATQTVAPADLAPVQTGSETILVAEDDPLVRNNLVTQLRSLGYTTHAAADAQEALACSRAASASTCC